MSKPIRRRAVAAIFTTVVLLVLLGFASFTIDVGLMYNARADQQSAADAAALAAASILSDVALSNAEALAVGRATASTYVQQFQSLGDVLQINTSTDVVFGRANFDPVSFTVNFQPTEVSPDAVRITVRRSGSSPNDPLPLVLAGIWGRNSTNISASAVAALTGLRDLAVVIDLSGSMKHDSYLRFHDVSPINCRDMWCSLDGPPPSRPYLPGADHETEYALDTGPIVGVMDTWGDTIVTGSYDPRTDPGLWYIPQGADCTEPDIEASLVARGYSWDEIYSVMDDGSNWTNRVAVMIGLAEWTPSSGSDTSVSDSELDWIPYPPYRIDWVWADYIGWASEANNKLNNVHPEFHYQYGLKTYVDFLLDRKDNHSQTDLTDTPEQPLRAVKDAVQVLVDETRLVDHLSLEIFGSTGRHEVDLTPDRQQVADRLYNMQPNHYDNSTNMGAGLQRAIEELTSLRARNTAKKVILMMSDGRASMGPDPLQVAQDAADAGIKIFTVSVGYTADRDTLQQIAAIGGGQEFYASGTPEEYTAQLAHIFRTIGRMGSVALIE